MDLLFDFVVKLPKCCRRNCVFQHILMVVDRLTKRWLYKLLETLHTNEFINVMYHWMLFLYKFPLTTVNNRDSQMTATLWRWLCKRYNINIKFSLAHYPEMDGQTKSANRVMKNYFCTYIAYTQDNWVDYLPMAKFAASNHVNALMGVTPFFADHGFYSRTDIEPLGIYEGERQVKLLAVDKIVCR